MTNLLLRQGDVLLIATDEVVPQAATRVKRNRGRLVLAEGEATGHAHTIATRGVELYDLPATGDLPAVDALAVRLLVAETEAVLTHQEHAAITIPPGTYRVIRQREYAPDAIRNVAD